LERSPEEISLLELIEAIDGPLHSALPVGEGIPLQYDARLRDALESITQTARQQLSAIKLSDLLEPPPNSASSSSESGSGEENLRSQDWPTAGPAELPNKHGGNGGNYSGNPAGSEFQERNPT
jgi:hypothetical protein